MGTASVAVVEYGEEIDVGLMEQMGAGLGGQPEVERETVPLNPPPADMLIVDEAVPPAPIL